jgi:hypothetical protein
MRPQSKLFFNLLALPVLCLGSAVAARAELITLNPGGTAVDFSQFSGFIPTYTSGPVQIGGLVGEDITWSTTNATSQIGDGLDPYGFLTNGFWDSGRNGFTGLNDSTGTMTFRFNSGPVSTVAGFINYAPGSGPNVFISALDVNGNVLESYDVISLAPIITPGMFNANDGAYRGISRATADIYAFTVSNQFVALDDLMFSRQVTEPVPEPTAMLLLGTGIAGMAAAVRRGRKSD